MKKLISVTLVIILIYGTLFQATDLQVEAMTEPLNHTMTNYIVNDGLFLSDSNGDGMSDGWRNPYNSTYSVSQGIQTINFSRNYTSTRTVIEGTAKNITGKDLYYLSMWIKTKAPDVRFFAIKKIGSKSYYPKVVLDNPTGEWQYKSIIIDMSDSASSYLHSIYLKGGKSDGSSIQIKNVNLFNLTKEFGLGKEPSKSEVDAIMNPDVVIEEESKPAEVISESAEVESKSAEEEIKTVKQENVVTNTNFTSVAKYGAVADSNYYNSKNGRYYKDSSYKYLATDNMKAFQAAFDSGKDISIPKGNYYVSDRVTLNKGIDISASGAVIYTKSSSSIKYLFRIAADNVKISGMTVKTTLDQKPILNNSKKSGLGSNVYAFVIQASNITIDNVTTYNISRGVHANKLRTSMKNVTVTNSKFYDATIPIFMMYTNGIKIDNCYLESNDSGLSSGFHSLYFGTQIYNAVVTNTDMNFKSVNNGGVIQIFSSKFNKASIENVQISNSNIVTKGTHLAILGEVKNLTFDNITFDKSNASSGSRSADGKLIFAHDYVYDVTIKNSTLNMDDAASIINGKGTNYGNIVLENNKITTTLKSGKNLFSTVMSVDVEDNNIELLNNSAGIFFGFGGKGVIDFSDNTVVSKAPYILLGSGHSGSGGKLILKNNDFNLNNNKKTVAFYNNTNKMTIQATGNSFLNFTKLSSYTINTTDKNNKYLK